MTTKEKIDHRELARTIYRDLRKGIGNAVVWRLCDQSDVAPIDIDLAVKCSNGHLKVDNGIVRIEDNPKGDAA